MKENEENLNSSFDLKVKHDLSERLKTEAPVASAPSPILASRVKKLPVSPIIVLAVALAVSIVGNIVLGIFLASSASRITQLEDKVEAQTSTIDRLKTRLSESADSN